MTRRARFILIAITAVATMWLAVLAGNAIVRANRMTPEKIRAFVNSTDLARLSPLERARAIQQLADKVNSLTVEERRLWRREGNWRDWFLQMTEDERSSYLDATLPKGIQQVINSFENLPEATRKQAIDDAMQHLRETGELPLDREPGQTIDAYGTNGPPPLTPGLEKKVRAVGLRTFYSESSAQTKAELAPLLEELQHQMQAGHVAMNGR